MKDRAPYFAARYSTIRSRRMPDMRAYWARNREVINLARRLGVSIPEARLVRDRRAAVAKLAKLGL